MTKIALRNSALSALALFVASFFYVGTTFAEDCTKRVAHKYCLGGSFMKGVRDHRNNKKFTLEKIGVDKAEMDSATFVDSEVFGLESVTVQLIGKSNRIVAVKVLPNFDLLQDREYVRDFAEAILKVREKYCQPEAKIVRKKEASLLCDAGSYLVANGIELVNDSEFRLPMIGYLDRTLLDKHSDKGY